MPTSYWPIMALVSSGAILKTISREEIEKQFFGEVRCPFSEPDQKVLNAIDSKIKEEGEAAKDFIVEEIIKNPRILINKSHNPTIFKPGMWYNLAHLLCQVIVVLDVCENGL